MRQRWLRSCGLPLDNFPPSNIWRLTVAITTINVCTDAEIKRQAQQIFAAQGLDMAMAINLFLRQTVHRQEIPSMLLPETPTKMTP
ncbi:MAG TPA: hypothetical protein DEB25_09440, partial [Desulfobulbaceae bacterium]|nr:hypothetical protein [Desulfobulbaceae bacterium]